MRRFLAALLILINWTAGGAAETNLGRLRKKLLNGYDKTSRPVVKEEDSVNVRLAFHLRHIQELDDKKETLSVEGLIKMQWTDEYMVWNPAEYGNLTHVRMGDHEIWQPDVYLFHSTSQNTMDGDQNTYVYIDQKGRVTWQPPASLRVPCTTSHTYYPFELHFCQFEFGSWTHSGDDLFLQPYDDFNLDDLNVTGGEWRIVNWTYAARMYNVIKTNPYNSVVLTLTLQRTSSLHKITSVIPVVTSSLLSLAGFWLDAWSTSRYVLGLGNFAVVAVHLLNFGTTVTVGRDIPLIAQFSATAVCMAAIFMVLTVVLDSRSCSRSSPPETLFRLCSRLPGTVLCLPEETDRPNSSGADDREKIARDWRMVCRVFDRIAFWMFAIVYVVVTSLLFTVL